MQKLPLTAAEIRDVLRLTLANVVESISINTDIKGFYQLKERVMLKARREGFPEKKKLKNPQPPPSPQIKQTTSNPSKPTQVKRRGLKLKLIWFIYAEYIQTPIPGCSSGLPACECY